MLSYREERTISDSNYIQTIISYKKRRSQNIKAQQNNNTISNSIFFFFFKSENYHTFDNNIRYITVHRFLY